MNVAARLRGWGSDDTRLHFRDNDIDGDVLPKLRLIALSASAWPRSATQAASYHCRL